MKQLRYFFLVLSMAAISAWAAERIVVNRVQLAGPMGTDTGRLIMTGDEMIFVDDVNPDMSFTVPRSDIRSLRYANGVMTMDLRRPFNGAYGSRSDVYITIQNPSMPNAIANWVGVPLSGETTVVTSQGEAYRQMDNPEYMFNVKNGDEPGRLIVGPNRIDFECLTKPKQSRTWDYRDIRSFERKGDKVELKPYHGQEYEFYFTGKAMANDVYNIIADRIVAARRGR